MKVLIQHHHRYTEISGVLTYVHQLKSGLEDKNIEISLISTKEDSVIAWIKKIATADVVHMNSNHLAFAILCKIFLKRIVIKYHYLFYQSIHSTYVKTSLAERVKTELVSYIPKKNYPLKWKLHALTKPLRLMIRSATALLVNKHIACSHFLAESHLFPWTVETIYNPIKVSKQDAPKELSCLTTPYTFVFVGRLNRDKGVNVLLQAIALLKNDDQDLQVLIIGDGAEAEKLKSLATELEISNHVHFLGQQSHEQVLYFLRSALALVVPSRWNDPAPYVVLEAASVQTCSIVTRMGGLPELVGTHGLIVEPEDATSLAASMKSLLDDPQHAIVQGIASQQYIIEQFSTDVIVEQTLRVFQSFKSTPERS